jgi:hypothetical protein
MVRLYRLRSTSFRTSLVHTLVMAVSDTDTMENEKDSLPGNEYDCALTMLLVLGLIEVVPVGAEPGYRLSEAILTNEFAPNAALRDRLE